MADDLMRLDQALPPRYRKAVDEKPRISAEEMKAQEAKRLPMFDYCECNKTPGAWGQGRFHYVRLTENRCRAMADREIRERLRREGPMKKGDEAMLREQIEGNWMRYLGTAIAYEECQVVVAQIERHCREMEQGRRGYALAEGL